MNNRLMRQIGNFYQKQHRKIQIFNQRIKNLFRTDNFQHYKIFKFLLGLIAGVTTATVIAIYLTGRVTPSTNTSTAPTANTYTAPSINTSTAPSSNTSTAPNINTNTTPSINTDTAPATSIKTASTTNAYTTSWLGNTFGGGDKWVQIQVSGIYVAPDGTVYTNSPWDEAAREVGIYKDGDAIGKADDLHGWGRGGGSAIAVDQKYMYVAMGQSPEGKAGEDYPPKGTNWYCVRRYKLSGKPAPFPGGRGWDKSMLIVSTKDKVTGLAVSDGRLYVSDKAAGQVRVYDTATMKELRKFAVSNPGNIAIDKQKNLWIIQNKNGKAPAKIVHYSPTGKQLPGAIADIGEPTAIAVDNQGRLLVADNGPRQQVLIYDIKSKPKQVGTFGTKGGIYADKPGEIGALKFYGLSGIGTDAAGNIYISNDGFNRSGVDLRKFSPSGQLQWQLLGLQFVDNADADPSTDGVDVFTKDEHFVMDYSKGSGKEWQYKGYTLDKFRYPSDGRLHTMPTAPFVRRIQGKRLMYISSEMMSERLLTYRFDGEIAVPCGIFGKGKEKWLADEPTKGSWIWVDVNGDGSPQAKEYQATGEKDDTVWGWEIDSKGDVWQAAEAGYIKHYRFQGLNAHGCPRYSRTAVEKIPMPKPFKVLTRIKYFPEQDVMYLSGYTSDRPNIDGDWGLAGTEVVRYDNWSKGKNRNPSLRIVLPYNPSLNPKLHIKAIDIAGNRLFAADSKHANVFIYDTTTGKLVQQLKPGPEVAGETGWVDIPYGVRAFRRSNGEYLVFVEEVHKAKVIMYRLPA
ncbi:MAG: hypothetical protein HXY43_14485 [Fischerella sp.]|uniref:hypothetical protein n=1 Tax=Fischerella sp. TaxID=1191 RepID=UPI0017E4D770|nr:hypothetical protein [Fischerella sp.]NWF60427.1 hypothetical protein [Fischerella sp.]